MPDSRNAATRSLALACWIPLASLIAVEIYALSFDGWGTWATAPLFLLPLILSLVIAVFGAVQCIVEARGEGLRGSSVVSTLIALLPLAWLLIRRHII